MPDHWNQPLSRPLGLRGRERLITLRDAAEYLVEASGGVTRDDVLAAATQLLMQAAATGKEDDIQKATDQVATYLSVSRGRTTPIAVAARRARSGTLTT
jgi:hypothetical protein